MSSLAWWIRNADTVLGVMLCAVPVVLLLAAGWTHIINTHPRGVWIKNVHYEDYWRDD